MKLIIFSFVMALLLISLASAEIIISEIMYSPTQDDNYNEWIELYNSGDNDINLSEWKLCGKAILPGYVDHTENETKDDNGLILESKGYAIVSDGGTGTDVYSNFDIVSSLAVHVDASSLCNGALSNDGKEIILIKDNETISVDYSSEWGADNNGMSLQIVNDEWCEGNPTPGEDNGCYEENPDEHNLEGDNETQNNESVPPDDETLNDTITENDTEISDESADTENKSADTGAAKQTAVKKTLTTQTVNENTSSESKKVIYQSKNEKTRETAIYLLIALLVLIIIYLIKSKNI